MAKGRKPLYSIDLNRIGSSFGTQPEVLEVSANETVLQEQLGKQSESRTGTLNLLPFKPFEPQDVSAIQESTRQPFFKTEEQPKELSRAEQTIKSIIDSGTSAIENLAEGKTMIGAIDLLQSIAEIMF